MNPTCTELTVIIKNEESRFRHKFLCYNDYVLKTSDPYVQQCVEEAKRLFKGEPEEIQVKVSMQYQ